MTIKYPYKVNSWIILSEDTFIKNMDKSTFKHNGTGIPKKIQYVWQIDSMRYPAKKQVILRYDGKMFNGNITIDRLGRTKLYWMSDFERVINEKYYELSLMYKTDEDVEEVPQLRFKRVSGNEYDVDFIDIIQSSVIQDGRVNYSEGRVIYAFSKKYERNPSIRMKAIDVHGLTCKACGFHFKKGYGTLGDGYIEIHHLKPLYENGKEVEVDINNDLTALCSNCHRVVHRKRDKVVGLEELREKIRFNVKYD